MHPSSSRAFPEELAGFEYSKNLESKNKLVLGFGAVLGAGVS
jgi:hypothetical protein